jgi:hypothetical protein
MRFTHINVAERDAELEHEPNGNIIKDSFIK